MRLMKGSISTYYLKSPEFAEFYLCDTSSKLIQIPMTVLSKDFIDEVLQSEDDIRVNWQDLVVGKIYYGVPNKDSLGRFIACKVLIPMVSIRRRYPKTSEDDDRKNPYYLEIFRKGNYYIVREYGQVTKASEDLDDIIHYIKTYSQHFGSVSLCDEVRDTFANLN